MRISRPYITDIKSDLIPDASGTRDIGSASLTFAEGHFDNLYVSQNNLQIGDTFITAPSGIMTFTDTQIGPKSLSDLSSGSGGSFFGEFGGNGTQGAITVSSATNVSDIDGTNPGIVQATEFIMSPGQVLTVDTTFLYLAVQGTCTISGTISADGKGLSPNSGQYFTNMYRHGIGPGTGAPPVEWNNGQTDKALHYAFGATAATPYAFALSGAGGGGDSASGGTNPGWGAGAGGAGGPAMSGSGLDATATPSSKITYLTSILKSGGPGLANILMSYGGSGGTGENASGAPGGGVIYIECNEFIFDGIMTADGAAGGGVLNQRAGGGGGGLIVVRANTITTNTGSTTVTGGSQVGSGDGAAGQVLIFEV